jgi:hypothetical protein
MVNMTLMRNYPSFSILALQSLQLLQSLHSLYYLYYLYSIISIIYSLQVSPPCVLSILPVLFYFILLFVYLGQLTPIKVKM